MCSMLGETYVCDVLSVCVSIHYTPINEYYYFCNKHLEMDMTDRSSKFRNVFEQL